MANLKPHRDPPPLLHPWWGKDCIPWCRLRCFYFHCKRFKFSCFVGIHPHFFTIFFFLFSYQQVNIVLKVDDICTLVDVVITNLIWINLVSQVTFSCGVVGTMSTQVKKGLYCNHYAIDKFFFLVIKVFGCLYQQFDSFFINVLTWHGQQKALKFLLYRCYIHFINKEYWWFYWRHRLPPYQGRLLL
jgi:hypothetical protein